MQQLRNSTRLPPILGKSNAGNRIRTEQLSDSSHQQHVGLRSKIRPGYGMASYTKALDYLHSQSYTKKVTGPDGNPDYEPFQVCVDTEQLRQYGLGVFLYLQFVKRLAATFLIMSAINIVPIIYSYQNGSGLSSYTQSYMITLAKTSLGNINNGDQVAYLIYTVCDILSMIVLFGFYLHWRSFHAQAVDNQTKDLQTVNPTNYVLSVTGFDPHTQNLQKNLNNYIDQVFPGAYQVQVVYNYNGNFSKFVYYDQLIQQKQKEKQVMVQTGKNNDDFIALEKEISEFQDQLSHISQVFEPQYAIIHFRTLKARNDFINFCRKYSLIDKFSSSLTRFLCCQHLPPQSNLFMKKDALMIKTLTLSRPQQINWQNLDVSGFSRLIRWIFAIIFIIISIVITSSLIALCTLYVSSTSACTNFNPLTTLTKASSEGGQTLYCYCAAHFTQIYTDTSIESACKKLSNTILYANLMQVGASLVSSVSNVILILAVALIAKFILKSDSKPKQYSFIFVSVLLSNYINASILPLIMNGDIFGFQSLHYLNFINFIDFNKVAIFKDYNTDWYAIVGPYYINFMIIAIISPIINLFITCFLGCITNWRVRKACQNENKEKPVIQKQANVMITSMVFDLPTQKAIICLNFIVAVMYSSLLPILIPITTVYLIVTFFCKKAILLRYSVRIPADQALSQKFITIMPFVLLAHFLMGIWSHTAAGVFKSNSYIIQLNIIFFAGETNRVFHDILMLGAGALILVFIIFDYTVINFFRSIAECFKDELDIPKKFASIENRPYQDYIKNANILGSYKIVNNPIYGHAIKAYQQLKKRRAKETMKRTMKQVSQQGSPTKFGQRTMQTIDLQRNNQIVDNNQGVNSYNNSMVHMNPLSNNPSAHSLNGNKKFAQQNPEQ